MLSQKYDSVVFDLLTALLDSWTLWNSVAGGVEPGLRWRRRYLELTYGCGAYRPYEDLVAEAAADTALPAGCATALAARWEELAPWPEVPGLLARLREQGLKLGVATNCSIPLGRRAAARCGVAFDAVITSEEAGFYKPRPEPYRAVLAALGSAPARTLFVAGSAADVPGAAAVGMPVVWHNRAGLPSIGGIAPLAEAPMLGPLLSPLVAPPISTLGR
jgi:2-haloalkanoic acid dehalogenase type II